MRRTLAIGAICLAVGGCSTINKTTDNVFGSTGRAEAEQQMSYHFNETPVEAPSAEPAATTHKARQLRKRTRAPKAAAAPAQAAPAEAEPPSE
jgi:hypothetical protein